MNPTHMVAIKGPNAQYTLSWQLKLANEEITMQPILVILHCFIPRYTPFLFHD